MGRLGEAKTLGGIGSILQLIPFLSIVGYILTLIAIKYVSDELNDRSVFNNALYGVLALVAGTVVGLFALFTGIFTSVFTLGVGALLGVASFLVILWVALIIASIFIRRSFDTISARLGVNAFKTAGLLYFIGALLTIVFFVGLIVIFVGVIFQIIAFFSISETPMQPQQMQPMQPAAPGVAQAGMKFCPNCGSQIAISAEFCPKCGAKQPA